MFSKLLLSVLLFGLVSCQVEQSIFAQFYRHPQAVAKEQKKEVTQPAAEATTESSAPRLEVLPLLARSRRSGFNSEADQEGNDAALARVRHRLEDPGWFPEIVQRVQRYYDD